MGDGAAARAANGTPLRAVIVDDEPSARDAVRLMLADHAEVEVVAEAANGKEAVRVLRETRPDLLFLDLQRPDLDGFGVLEALGDEMPRGVVFVTAHDEHAIRAFEVHALDYLVKPFGRPRFAAAVSGAIERLRALDALSLQQTLASVAADRALGSAPAGELSISAPAGQTPAMPGAPRRIGVRNGAKTVLVKIDSIDWVEASRDYARIHAGARTHVVSQRMSALEGLLEGCGFVRVHRSLIVNATRVRELHRAADGSGLLVLANGVRLRVSRGRWEEVGKRLHLRAF
jgi:two-component system LytT family response regulator